MYCWLRIVSGTIAAAMTLVGCGVPVPAPTYASSVSKLSASAVAPTTVDETLIAAPVSIDVPSIDVLSSLVPLGIRGGMVEVPPVSTPEQAGWYAQSPRPGQTGPAVILGHVDGYGREGVFYHLHEIKVGAQINVRRTDGSQVTFFVTRVDQIKKKQFPAEQVYANTIGPEIRLITCGGKFDRHARSYVDNIIVWAKA